MIDTDFGYWFAGFTDGEGCFRINFDKRGSRYYGFEFSIGLRKDDQKILEEIQNNINAGGVYFETPKNKPGQNNSPIAKLRVFNRKDCQKIIDIFTTFPLRSKKKRDFEIWKKAFQFKMSHQHNKESKEIIAQLRRELQDVKKYK